MFIGFAIRPEWDSSLPLDPGKIQVDPVYSRHFQQVDSYRPVLQHILQIIRQELALPHVYGFPSHVGQVMHGRGYSVNREPSNIIENRLVMAQNLPPPVIPTICPFVLRHPNILRDVHLLPSTGVSCASTVSRSLDWIESDVNSGSGMAGESLFSDTNLQDLCFGRATRCGGDHCGKYSATACIGRRCNNSAHVTCESDSTHARRLSNTRHVTAC